MLKRKLNKAVVLATSLLVMAASSGSWSSIEQAPTNTLADCIAAMQDSTIMKSPYQSSKELCDCISNLPEDQREGLPQIQLNTKAVNFVKDHQKKNGFGLEKLRTAGDRYFPVIDKIFTEHNLPVELKYLAVVESRLNARSASHVGAKGMWQFMATSARQFGLKVNGKNDERLNAYKSSVAAAKCLTYLYEMFDDWLLTVAAYNSGPGYVLKAIKKSGSRDFWTLQRFLPEETRNHVKRFISIHYFYEGSGSLVTMTRSETKAHIAAIIDYAQMLEGELVSR